MSEKVGLGGFLGRWVFALILVLGSYNPSGYSFATWVVDPETSFGPVITIVGLVLLIGWIFCLKATFNALGWLGVTLFAALFAAIIWLLVDKGLISVDSSGALTWLSLIVIALILAVGMAWSNIKRRITGQYNIDDVDD